MSQATATGLFKSLCILPVKCHDISYPLAASPPPCNRTSLENAPVKTQSSASAAVPVYIIYKRVIRTRISRFPPLRIRGRLEPDLAESSFSLSCAVGSRFGDGIRSRKMVKLVLPRQGVNYEASGTAWDLLCKISRSEKCMCTRYLSSMCNWHLQPESHAPPLGYISMVRTDV